MLSRSGTIDGTFLSDDGTFPDETGTDERWHVVVWGLIAFALGMLSAWIGAMAWIAMRFLTM